MSNGSDHDALIRLEQRVDALNTTVSMQLGHLTAQIESEKGTRARSHERLHADIKEMRAHVDEKFVELTSQLHSRVTTSNTDQEKRTRWLERIAWGALGALGFVAWWMK